MRRARRRRRAGPFIGILVTAGWQEGFLPQTCRPLPSGLSTRGRPRPTHPQVEQHSRVGWGRGGLYAGLGSWDRRGDVHPHLLARSLSPGTWCCPPDPGVGWQTGFMQQVDRKGSDTQPRSPWWEGEAGGAMLWPERSKRSICSVRTGVLGGAPSAPGPKVGEVQMAPPCQGQGPVSQAPRAARGQLAAQATPWHGR